MPGTVILRGKEVELRPLANRVILRSVGPPEREEGELWIPPEAEWVYKQLQGEVVATGPLVSDDVWPGMRVVVPRFKRVHIGEEGEWYVMADDDVIAAIW